MGPLEAPGAQTPRRIALLETVGWERATAEAKAALQRARDRLAAAGIEVADRRSDQTVAEVESAIARAHPLSMDINAWEGRWPLNTYARDMDRAGLSKSSQDRLAQAETMTQEEYQALIAERDRDPDELRGAQRTLRRLHDALGGWGRPVGLGSTGDPIFAVPSSLLGVPTLSLPVLQDQGLPLGLQLIGFANQDAALFGAAAAVLPLVEHG